MHEWEFNVEGGGGDMTDGRVGLCCLRPVTAPGLFFFAGTNEQEEHELRYAGSPSSPAVQQADPRHHRPIERPDVARLMRDSYFF